MTKKLLIVSIALFLSSCLNIKNSAGKALASTLAANEIKLNGATAKQITLDNNLLVTLISAPTSAKSSISIAVNVGHLDNPVEHQGLAHYLEHMLFLGTKNFPDVDEYKKFVRKNGGQYNAYTANDHTNYYLDIRSLAFEEAVHRMSRFFVDPLFDATYSEREKNAIENEFRFLFERFAPYRAYSIFYREDAKSRLFNVGNFESLGDTRVEDTKNFYKKNYYTEAMHAVLAGPQSHAELEALAVKYLSDIESRPEQELNVHEEKLLIDQSKLPATVLARPFIGDQTSINIFIPFKEEQENKDVLNAITVLIGDKSETSLMKFFVDKGWINADLDSYSADVLREGVYFSLENLRDEGIRNKKAILDYIYTYMIFVSTSDVPTYLSAEILAANESEGRLSSYYEINGDLIREVNSSYFKEDPKTLSELLFGKDPKAFSDEEYKEVLNNLNWSKPWVFDEDPNNPVIERSYDQIENLEIGGFKIVEQEGKRTMEDSIYQYAFEITGVAEFNIKTDVNFALKSKNPYSPSDFEVYNSEPSDKYQKVSGDWGEMYWSDLGEAGVAFTHMSLDLYSHGIDFDSTVDVASLFLMRELLQEQVLFGAYPLVQMGYSYDFPIKIFSGVMTLEFNGWSKNYLEAFKDFLRLSSLMPKRDAFEAIKRTYSDKIADDRVGDMESFTSRTVLSRVTKSYLDYDEILGALDDLDYETYTDFTKRFFEGLYFRGAISGDILKSHPEKIINSLLETWGVNKKSLKPDFSNDKLASDIFKNKELKELSEIGPSPERSTYYSVRNLGPVESVKEELILNIMGTWMGPDYSTELRTNQGLAYSLYAYVDTFVGHYVLISKLISLKLASFTSKRADEFVTKWATEALPEKSQELLEITVAALKANELTFPLSPSQAHEKYYELVSDGMQSLKAHQQRVAIYDEITLEEVINFGQNKLLEVPKAGVFLNAEKATEN